jgi:DnaD/phage-associated family protein
MSRWHSGADDAGESRRGRFGGFPDRARQVPIPDVLFSHVLPAIEDVAELKVVLHVIWRARRRLASAQAWPCLSEAELVSDPVLRHGLAAPSDQPIEERIRGALAAATRRGVLLGKLVHTPRGKVAVYAVNDVHGRRAMARLTSLPGEPTAPDDDRLRVAERPNIYTLYEQSIGLLTPILADELRDAEQTYPAEWLEDAFRAAAASNVRRWAYVRTILERWAQEGRDSDETDSRDTESRRKRYTQGPYGRWVEH